MKKMPSFRNIKELKNHLNTILINAMDKVGDTALEHMKKHVSDKMQDRVSNQSGLYDRTYEYLLSIEKIKAHLTLSGAVEVIIHYNTDGINPYIIMNSSGLWNKHADFNGNDVSSLIPLFLEEGTPNNPYYEHEPVGGIANLEEWAKKYFKSELKKELKKLGINTK
jgi:hypothetical protein